MLLLLKITAIWLDSFLLGRFPNQCLEEKPVFFMPSWWEFILHPQPLNAYMEGYEPYTFLYENLIFKFFIGCFARSHLAQVGMKSNIPQGTPHPRIHLLSQLQPWYWKISATSWCICSTVWQRSQCSHQQSDRSMPIGKFECFFLLKEVISTWV